MDEKVYCLDLEHCTTDVYQRLYDAAKWCYENRYKTKYQVNVSEEVYKNLHNHPQLRGKLGISKYFPPEVEILGFCFVVDFNAVGARSNVPVMRGYDVLEDVLVFEF